MLSQPKSTGELIYQLAQARKGIDIKKPVVKSNDLSHLPPIERLTAARKSEAAKLAADNLPPLIEKPKVQITPINWSCPERQGIITYPNGTKAWGYIK